MESRSRYTGRLDYKENTEAGAGFVKENAANDVHTQQVLLLSCQGNLKL